jgi:glycosyltransferase involved in cell wall biosynthesis
LRTEPRVAVIDGASFVLPYDHGLIGGLARRGWQITLFASRTRYNEAFLQALEVTPGVQTRVFEVSRTVAPRWRGAWNYVRMWLQVWRRRNEFDAINLQFSILWPVERPFLWLLRRRFVLTVHNAVPHGFTGARHGPTATMLAWAHRVVFVSNAVRDDAQRRYGSLPRASVLPHGLLPLAPGELPKPYGRSQPTEALVFWGNVTAYKGVELILALARSPQWAELGLSLEVHGAFDPAVDGLRDQLIAAGVHVHDHFLSADELHTLFARPVVFVLPYRRASQSGALYTLLHQGCRFLCSDSGDLGDFMRRHDLHEMLIQHDDASVVAALKRLQDDPMRWTAAFQAAQLDTDWETSLANASVAYGMTELPQS